MKDYYQTKILLAEDDEDDVDFFRTAIEFISPQTIFFSATGCKAAFSILERGDIPDIIFIDLLMFSVGRIECIGKLKLQSEYSNIPIVALSSTASTNVHDLLFNLGVNYFVTKPPTIDKLQIVIDRIVNTPDFFNKKATRDTFHLQETE